MITRNLRLATRTTFYGLTARAIFPALINLGITLGVSLGVIVGALDTAKAQQNRVRTYSQSEVERLIRDVEQSSQDFERDFDSWLGRSRFNGQQRDSYNQQVQNLTNELSTLRSNFDRGNDWWMARRDTQRVLNAATPVNSAMNNREVRGGLNRQWGSLRRNLDRLAAAFNLPPVGSTYTGSPVDYPDLGDNVRSCSVTGTYRGYTNNGETELTIAGNGTATARSLITNAVYNGRCANDVLYFDWGAFNLVRDGRNVATVEIGNPQNRTPYRRVSGNQGDYGQRNPDQRYPDQRYPNQNYPDQRYPNQSYPNQGYPEQVANVPNWAIGTFRGLTDSGESELTISPNGIATARSLSTNQLFTGRYANDLLTFDWGSFRIVRERNGISTIEVGNEQNRTSYRRVN